MVAPSWPNLISPMMDPQLIKTVSCPQCGRPVEWSPKSRYRPFCSERCRLIDLGEWATESYRIPDETVQEPGEPGEGQPG